MSNRILLKCKAILFDMDGTLVDSTQVVERAWGWWAALHSLPLEDVLTFSHGRPGKDTVAHFLPGQEHAQELAQLSHFEETETEGIRPVPGALKVLQALEANHLTWAIVTSAWRKLAEIRVAGAGLPLPDIIVPIDEIHNGKPDPEGFLRAAKLLDVAPAECVVFEDTRPGIDAGLSARMQVVGLSTTFSAQQLRHRPVIRDFHDVTVLPDGEGLTVEIEDYF